MNISINHPDKNAYKAVGVTWLQQVLDSPGLQGYELPTNIKGYIYINGMARLISPGSWEMNSDTVYMARSATPIEPLTRLALLSAVANLTGAIEEPTIVEKITSRLEGIIQDSVKSVYAGFLRSAITPSRLAVNQVTCQVAVELNGAWALSNGTPVEVNESWITMNF